MANTTQIKKLIEPHVRDWLASKFPGHEFKETSVTLKWGGVHKFDAVSEDRSIVAEILSNGAKTRGGKENTGGVRKAEGDLLRFHGIDDQTTKIMVFTDAAFLELTGILQIKPISLNMGLSEINRTIKWYPERVTAL